MDKFNPILLTAALAIIMAFANPGHVLAQNRGEKKISSAVNDKTDVTVVNTSTNPVPITVQGTADVNVSNTPTVKLASGTTVQVGNTETNPVRVQNTDESARQPFRAMVNAFFEDSTIIYQDVVTVPAGKRLVIEYVSGMAAVGIGQKVLFFIGHTRPSEPDLFYYFTATPQGELVNLGAGKEHFTACQLTRIYAEAGENIYFRAKRSSSDSVHNYAQLTISGYFVDVPSR
jgi:hypothetical protein